MTRTTSLIIGIAVAALVAVPTAFGAYGLGDAPGTQATQPDVVKLFYANERATMPFPAAIHDHGSATQAKLLVQSPSMNIVRDNGDATQAKLRGTQPDVVKLFYANERATMSMGSTTLESPAARAERLRSEGLNKLYGLGEFASTVSTRKVEPQSVIAERLRSEGLNKRYGLGEFAPTVNSKDTNERGDLAVTPVAEPVATSGTDVEWRQIGIGVGIGIALAIALGLSFRVTRHRPLAH